MLDRRRAPPDRVNCQLAIAGIPNCARLFSAELSIETSCTFLRGNSLLLKLLGKSPRLEGGPTTVPRVPVP